MIKEYKNILALCSALLVNFNSTCVFAQNVDVTFSANIIETTCEMKLEGGTGNGINNTIPIGSGGKVSLDKIIQNDPAATMTFKIKIVECPAGVTSIKTTIRGTPSAYKDTAIISDLSGEGASSFLGVTIARTSASNQPFVINSTADNQRLNWSSAEINAKEVSLISRLIETQSGKGTTGNFSAVATFNFEYE
ncbi:fimbrial protein [Rahnella aquatilis CIP 78.65 = ATCC 33071]|uniref:P pilus assembly protein, pilin FimA n=1 Tax=Rahnella aquatilis (strain ATCC 33071 / DSM 4594 / JCM 1683 / NBRC 105701 / NCIMB 13365 / CIP 78.65) TaxID=745277 RepID=H2J124_RAHAC|nr:fimbrial protein [Rahnella aquatilis]AEX53402.1 P pilus assembly protein, pilin FimA [Rahnella aquatilis CIP 78.65 = ATCC 33071]KFD03516.1 fimbrial protein [Rahnella aquatilis CIP 78.65 = ATCC 33071]